MFHLRAGMGGLLRVLFVASTMFWLAAPAAANTGTISGVVFDQDGMPVADASVKVTGDAVPAGRTTRTDANGVYHFEYLPPGQYTVTVEGVQATATRAAVVELGRDTRIE